MYGDDMHVLRLELLAQLVDLGVDVVDHFRDILVLEGRDDAFDRRRIPVHSQNAFGLLVRVAQRTKIAHQDRHAVGLRHNDVAEIVKGVNETDATDDEGLVAARDAAAAGIRGVVVDRVDDVVDAEIVAQQLGRIEIDPELPGEAAEIVDIGDARHLP